jgi:hypothetical protein
MNKRLTLGGLAGLLALAAGAATAAATVTFVEPERYADVPLSALERDRVLNELRGHFEKLASTLPAGQELKVEVLDVDLAGNTRPASTRPDLRIVTGGADWPHMHFRYSLVQDGKVLKSGDERLSDMDYTHHINSYRNDSTLRYEKQMLDDWFRKVVKKG